MWRIMGVDCVSIDRGIMLRVDGICERHGQHFEFVDLIWSYSGPDDKQAAVAAGVLSKHLKKFEAKSLVYWDFTFIPSYSPP